MSFVNNLKNNVLLVWVFNIIFRKFIRYLFLHNEVVNRYV